MGQLNASKKIPHDHSSLKGGVVQMMGDDHIELSRKFGSDGFVVAVWVTDKLRDPLTDKAGQVRANLISELDQKSSELSVTFDEKKGYFLLSLNSEQKKVTQARLEVFWLRNKSAKGVVTTSTPFKVSLSQIPLTR